MERGRTVDCIGIFSGGDDLVGDLMHTQVELEFEGERYYCECEIEHGEIYGMILVDTRGDLVNNPILEKQLEIILLGYAMDGESTVDLDSGEYDGEH